MFILQNRIRLFVVLIPLMLALTESCSIFNRGKNYETHENRFPLVKSSATADSAIDKDFRRSTFVSKTGVGHPQKVDNIHFGFGPQLHANPLVHNLNESKIDVRNFNSYKSISLFPKGQFLIEDGIRPLAIKTFSPLVDSIIGRAKQQASHSLIVQILIYGYTDGVRISDQSPLYQTLRPYMKKIPMTSENINLHLSYLRANEIGKIISEIVDQRKSDLDSFDKVFIQIVQEGKGEELPDAKKKYETNDERRRVVKIFWRVM